MAKNKIDKEKEKSFEEIFYSEGLSAWYSTRLERDKSLLTLSSAGLGGLILLMDKINNLFNLILFALAGLGFGMAIFYLLSVLLINADYISAVINQSPEEEKLDLKNTEKSKRAYSFFVIGVICISFLTLIIVIENYLKIDIISAILQSIRKT